VSDHDDLVRLSSDVAQLKKDAELVRQLNVELVRFETRVETSISLARWQIATTMGLLVSVIAFFLFGDGR
jgi:hypothetical protein